MSQSLVTGKTPKARASQGRATRSEDAPTARRRGARGARERVAAEGARGSSGADVRGVHAQLPRVVASRPRARPRRTRAWRDVFETWLAPPPEHSSKVQLVARASRGTKRRGGAASGVFRLQRRVQHGERY